jgi:hypothetical protein
MATVTVTKGYNNPTGWISGETVTPEKLNSSQTPTVSVSNIVNADIDASAAIAASKLALTGAVGASQLSEAAISGQTAITTLEGTDAFIVWDDTDDSLKKITQASLATQLVVDASITAAKINGVAKDSSGNNLTVGTAPVFGCRAWVNFDATKDTSGAASTANTNRLLTGSGNVSSVLRNAIGDYTITFTTAMPDANYAVSGTVFGVVADSTTFHAPYTSSQTSSSVRCYVRSAASGPVDRSQVSVSIFR